MKIRSLLIGILSGTAVIAGWCNLQGQPLTASMANSSLIGYQIGQQDGNSRVWQKIVKITDAKGYFTLQTNDAYVELATGLNHWDYNSQQWVPSSEEIDILADGSGAVATNGQHQVYFPADIYQGEIRMVTPDGELLQSRPLGLSYDDGQNTVLIAALTNSIGQLVSSNQVMYPNAFVGVDADLLYTYTKSGFEQDVIIRQQPPMPESFNMSPQNSKLQLLTEFFNPPQPTVSLTELPAQAGMALTDQSLNFGAMRMIRGKAFLLGANARDTGTAVAKDWMNVAGRQILVEAVPVMALMNELQALPPAASVKVNLPSPLHIVSTKRLLPAQHLAKASGKPSFMTKATLPGKGLVMDYITMTSQTNYTFQSNTTYYISGTVNLSGANNTFEGGAVLKYATNGVISFTSGSAVQWLTSAYRPVIYTAKDDNSVGDAISGSTGSPSGYYANPALNLNAATINSSIANVRFAYANQAISSWNVSPVIANSQFIACQNGITFSYCSLITFENDLFANVVNDFDNISSSVSYVQNTTFSSNTYVAGGISYVSLYFTNCIFANVTQNYSGTPNVFTGGHNGFYSSPYLGYQTYSSSTYPFQTAADANYYLTNGCAFRDVGVTNIDSALLASLRQMTTYAPQDGGFPDTNTPDLGYHYSTNADSDYDGLPDSWEWYWFGTYSYSGTNLDSQGNTLLYDYENGLDPDIIQFSLLFTNQYINSSPAHGSVTIQGGVPSYEAILVNDINLNDASWSAYSSTNVTVNFTTNGAYDVWVTLKGRATNATPTWLGTRLTYDTVPPTVTVTNPPTSTVSVPMIQLQGYVNESLSKLTYDVSNVTGVFTNQPGYWQASFYDTNKLDFTTNTFQCYDIKLANGVNKITLHATDLAGNVTTTNFSYTLSYTGVTNPPVVTALWPPNNALISGNSFTIQAQVNDATASVWASATGGTVQGLVERSGMVWMDNVPLSSGTNTVKIIAQNAAGKMSTNSLSVVQSVVSLTIDPLPTNELNRPYVTVMGTESDLDADVWVNGIEVYWTDDYDWYIDNVPVSATGTVVITAVAGVDTNDIEASQTLHQAQPPMVSLMSYTKYDHDVSYLYGYCIDWTGPDVRDETVNWLYGAGGKDSSTYTGRDGDCNPVNDGATTNLADGYDGFSTTWESAQASDSSYFYDIWGLTEEIHSYTAKTTLMILPPGLQAASGTALYLVSASAMAYSDPEDALGGGQGDVPIAPGTLQINGQTLVNGGITNADGSVLGLTSISSPAGATVPLTITTPTQAYSFTNVQVFQLISQCVATTPSDRSRTNLGVGEQVNFYFNPPLFTDYTNITWSATAGSLLFTNGDSTLFTAPSNAANATVTATVGTMPVSFYFKVFAPTGYASAQIIGTNAYPVNQASAGMTNAIWIGPTNVSFKNVWMEEIGEVATNATGYFANTNLFPASNLNHSLHGANQWFRLDDQNAWGDRAFLQNCSPPWTNGNFTWPIPVAWQVGSTNSPTTNYITGWNQNFLIDSLGTIIIQKFGNSVTRTTNNVITTTP